MPQDRPNRIPWPPLIYLAAAIGGLVAEVNYPLPWVTGGTATALQVLGAILGIGALAIDVIAAKTFAHHQTTILPHKAATTLITSGPYAWSRNPIYLGNTLLVLGAGLYFGKLWLVILAPVAAIITQKLAIEREEKHLAQKFGQQWSDYASKVRRWL
jgi:protein-S-isoprenylcysteine O-methyltransferase Ste14